MPKKVLNVGAKISTLAGLVIFRNLTKKEKITVQAVSGEALAAVDGWENSDKILIEVMGKFNYSTTITASSGAAIKEITTLTEDTSSPAVDL